MGIKYTVEISQILINTQFVYQYDYRISLE